MRQSKQTSYLNGNIKAILSELNIDGGFDIFKIHAGGNNRNYKLLTDDKNFCLKEYYWSSEDTRDRGKTEFEFLSALWNSGIRSISEPIHYDEYSHIGLFEFIEGNKIQTNDVNNDLVDRSLQFFKEINFNRYNNQNCNLLNASESCFTISDHISMVNMRIERLGTIDDSTSINKDVQFYINNKLLPLWDNIKKGIYEEAKKQFIGLNNLLPINERCLSPSDFGFHNAILDENDELKFIDFEYAGWDDPAKFVGDYFCQPSVQINLEYFHEFSSSVAQLFPNPEMNLLRYQMLLPLFQIKWCCIILNEFLPDAEKRRQFANNNFSINRLKIDQLAKAESALGRVALITKYLIGGMHHGIH